MSERHQRTRAVAIAARVERRARVEQRLAWLAFAGATAGAFFLMLLPEP